MERYDFKIKVQTYVGQSDFSENGHLLPTIESDDFDLFLKCLKYGFSLKNSFMVLDMIKELCDEYHLESYDVFDIFPKYRVFIAMLDS